MSSEAMPGVQPSVGAAEPDRIPRSQRGLLLLLAVLVFVVYWPALHGQFVWDDIMLVQRNPISAGHFGLLSIWFRTDFPLANIMFWLQWRMWGNHVLGYHVVNLLLHLISVWMLWRVLRLLRIRGALLAAAIFAVHPVCVASVAWISELKNTLSLPFYLLTIFCYLHFENRSAGDSRAKSLAWYGLAMAAYVMALSSKTTTVMLPPVLLACAWWQRGRLSRRDLIHSAPFFLLALAFGLLTISFQVHGAIRGATVQTLSVWGRLAGAGMALWFYLGKAVWPVNLMMVYPRWQISPGALVSYVPVLFWGCLLATCWWFRRGWGRHGLFGLGTFTITLFPVLGFLSMYYLVLSRVSDHFEYLPLVSIVTLSAAGLSAGLPARSLKIVAPALIIIFSFLTMQRARVFSNEEVLWRDTLARNPLAWVAHANLGWILAEEKKYSEAAVHLRDSLEINPDNAQAHCNLGRLLAIQGSFGDAEIHFLAALKLKPADPDIRKSYASALADQGRKDEAASQLAEALKARPDPDLHLQLAGLLFETGQFPGAIGQYRQALALKPEVPDALSNLAWLLATCSDNSLRNGREAVRFAERACRLTGFQQAPMLGVLAAAYAEAGDFTNAVVTARKTIELATAAGDQRFAGLNRQLLKLYLSGKAYHEPPAGGTNRSPQ